MVNKKEMDVKIDFNLHTIFKGWCNIKTRQIGRTFSLREATSKAIIDFMENNPILDYQDQNLLAEYKAKEVKK